MSARPKLLDLFCKAGGAGMGYHLAGFDVTGVDIEPQPNYPFDFIHSPVDAIVLEGYDVIHASPPCQANLRGLAAVNRSIGRNYSHADLNYIVRLALNHSEIPFVLEQPQQGAEMVRPVVYCGSSFGLPIRRHRQFESTVPLVAPPCNHAWQTEKKYWTSWVKNGVRQRATVVQVYGHGGERHEWGPALGIDWMTYDELAQAIPPAYTEHIGRQLIAYLSARQAA